MISALDFCGENQNTLKGMFLHSVRIGLLAFLLVPSFASFFSTAAFHWRLGSQLIALLFLEVIVYFLERRCIWIVPQFTNVTGNTGVSVLEAPNVQDVVAR